MFNKKIVLVSCLATFLLLSIGWIGPVQANSTNIISTIDYLSDDLVEDEDFIALFSDPDVIKFKNFIMAHTGEWDEEVYIQAEAFLNTIMEKEEFQRLVIKYGNQIEQIQNKIKEKNSNDIPEAPTGLYYTLTEKIDGLKINKVFNPNPEEEDVIVSSTDGSINIVGLGKIDGKWLNILINLLNFLANILGIVITVSGYIASFLSIAIMIVELFDEELAAQLQEIADLVGTIAGVVSSVYSVITTVASILEFVYKIITPRLKNAIESLPFTRFLERFFRFFELIKNNLFRPVPNPVF